MVKSSKRRRGFTLLEVLLVIAILVALGALVLPELAGRRETARIGTTKIQMGTVEDALEYFKTDVGRYPTTDEGLEALSNEDVLQDDELVEKWQGEYVTKKGVIEDAWGNEFHYECPGRHNEDAFDLWSNGPDGIEGTDDDITNWEEDEEY